MGHRRRRPYSSDAALPARRRLLRLHAANLSTRHFFVRARGFQDVRSGLSIGARTSLSGGARRRHRRVSRAAARPRSARARGRGRLCGRRTQRGATAFVARTWHCRCPPQQRFSRPSSISPRPASPLAPTAPAARCSTSESFGRAAQYYLGERDRCAPLASPLYADLQGLPPLLDPRRYGRNAAR